MIGASVMKELTQFRSVLDSYKKQSFDMHYDKNSHRRCSVRKCVVKNLANFTGKHLCWSLFLIKPQTRRPATLLKRNSNTGVFLWNLQKLLRIKWLASVWIVTLGWNGLTGMKMHVQTYQNKPQSDLLDMFKVNKITRVTSIDKVLVSIT